MLASVNSPGLVPEVKMLCEGEEGVGERASEIASGQEASLIQGKPWQGYVDGLKPILFA